MGGRKKNETLRPQRGYWPVFHKLLARFVLCLVLVLCETRGKRASLLTGHPSDPP